MTTPGYRVREVTLATTLLDAAAYPATELAELYYRRWRVEQAFFDSNEFLGLHDPRVWGERSVERAHPMGVVCRFTDGPVVQHRGSEGRARGTAPAVVREQGHSDVHGHVGRLAAANVGVRGFRQGWCGGALVRMR